MSPQAIVSAPSRFVWPGTSLNVQSLHHLRSVLAYQLLSASRIGSVDDGFKLLPRAISSKSTGFKHEARGQKSKSVELKRKIEDIGICPDSCTPGSFDLFYCPKCRGGKSIHRSLSVHISENWNSAMWRCFDIQCGFSGQILADTEDYSYAGPSKRGKNSSAHTLAMDSLRLQMLDDELLAYFAGRKISRETLQRNNVMQVEADEKIIAFTYMHNGLLVGCKYRTIVKKFWQEKNTEKWLYGLDDIAEADEIIIVEGELDKLSLEEAGYYNCVSVPSGAPQVVSQKELPSIYQDRGFQYLWNCQDYLDKASRIILATDGDEPGQALAEELARRLGKERCRWVRWPRRDESTCFKDANEVLEILGAEALRDAIKNAEFPSPDEVAPS